MQAARNTPFTPSVHAYYALVEALREFDDEGGGRPRRAMLVMRRWPSKRAAASRHAAWRRSCRPSNRRSSCARTTCLPGVAYEPLHDALKACGFVIYAGQGDLSKRLFRISTMGNLEAADMDRLLQAFDWLVK